MDTRTCDRACFRAWTDVSSSRTPLDANQTLEKYFPDSDIEMFETADKDHEFLDAKTL